MYFKITWEQTQTGLKFITGDTEIGSVEFEFEQDRPRLTEVDFAWHSLVKGGKWSDSLPRAMKDALNVLKGDYLSGRSYKEYLWRFLHEDEQSGDKQPKWYLTDQDPNKPITA